MSGGHGNGVVPTLTGTALVDAVPELADIATVTAQQMAQKASCALTFRDIWLLARRIRELRAQGMEGVIVTQGTDAIEETSFLLDCLLEVDMPVVVTGAMRNPALPGADGPANLLAAARVASRRQSARFGVLVVFDSQIHAARHVLKRDSVRAGAFVSPLSGPVGRVVEDRVVLFAAPPEMKRPVLDQPPTADIRMHVATFGERKGPVSRLCEPGCDGLVLAGMGGGHVCPDLRDEISAAARRIPVVLASRISGGQVMRKTYGYPGGEIDLGRLGVVSAGWLDPLKARILLGCLVTAGAGRENLRAMFRQFDGG